MTSRSPTSALIWASICALKAWISNLASFAPVLVKEVVQDGRALVRVRDLRDEIECQSTVSLH